MMQETKTCQNCKIQFTIEPDDFAFYEKIKVPPPTWCPTCRRVRRMMFRNERALYYGVCGLCKKNMLSTYAPDSPFTAYCKECWFSDQWDPLSYGVDYDWNKPFFEQFLDLKIRVPRLARMIVRENINSDYANFVTGSKNAYLAYSIVRSENIMYSRVVDDSRECLDCSDLQQSELAYENIQSDNTNRTKYLYACTACINASFLFDCVNCQNCFMSSNLRSRQYVFRNTQLTKEEYQKKIKEFRWGSHKEVQVLYNEYLAMTRTALHKYGDILKSVNSSGNNIMESKNVHYSFDIYNTEDAKYCDRLIGGSKDYYDVYGSASGELHYEGMAVTYGGARTKFVLIGDAMQDSHYTDYCLNSSYLFGCIGLQKKSYCILNKQYGEKEYKALIPKIIEHMNAMPYTDEGGRVYRYGEFFPPYQYAYNESIAQEYFPLTEDEVRSRGYRWRAPDVKQHQATLRPSEIPDDITEIKDDILEQIIGCTHAGTESKGCNEQCTRAFRITLQELQFYRQLTIPIPHLCPNCRHYQRLKIRNPLKLWHRKCMCDYQVHENSTKHMHHPEGKCSNEFETSYPPERPEVIYCEQCYNAEIV